MAWEADCMARDFKGQKKWSPSKGQEMPRHLKAENNSQKSKEVLFHYVLTIELQRSARRLQGRGSLPNQTQHGLAIAYLITLPWKGDGRELL
jgi:hypothetical protein